MPYSHPRIPRAWQHYPGTGRCLLYRMPIRWTGRLRLPLFQAGTLPGEHFLLVAAWLLAPKPRGWIWDGVSFPHIPPPWSRTRLGQAGPFWHLPLPPQAHAPKCWKLWVGIPPFFPLSSERKSGNFSPFSFFPSSKWPRVTFLPFPLWQ